MATENLKVWLVTGSSSGIGRAVVEHVLAQGYRVVATLRTPDALSALSTKYAPSQLLLVKLDVTLPSDITAAFAKAVDAFGRVDIVFSNAGYLLFGEAEATPDEIARTQFEVNFWGSANVSREAIRVFRDVNKPPGGRLLQVTSMGGIVSSPGCAYYNASKFALEGFCEALSKEIHPSWNIKVTIIQLGGFVTRAISPESMIIVPQHPAYAAPDNAAKLFRDYFAGDPYATSADPKKGAGKIIKIAEDSTVGLRVPLGLDAFHCAKAKLQELQEVVVTTTEWSQDLK